MLRKYPQRGRGLWRFRQDRGNDLGVKPRPANAPSSPESFIEREHASLRTGVNRRSFLGGLAAGVGGIAAVGMGGGLSSAALGAALDQRRGVRRPTRDQDQRARNVIVMVSDGMSAGTFTLADYIIRRDRGVESNWVKLNARRDARRAQQNTSSLSDLVTDSAAAASAWGSGERVNNGSVNVRPDGTQMLPLLCRAMQGGKRTGCVTTTRITHATPAGFYANSPSRELEDLIAQDLLDRGLDVALGGGARHFPKTALVATKGLQVVRTRDELLSAAKTPAPNTSRLIGLFGDSHTPYVLDRKPEYPTLVEMADAALTRLNAASAHEGFVLQIEGGRVDHAAHNNDAPSLVREQVEFDDTIGHVLKWLDGRDDTLLIVTTDHANANPGLTFFQGHGADGVARLSKATGSFDMIEKRLKKLPDGAARAEALGGIIEEITGVALKDEDVAMVGSTMQVLPPRVSPFRMANVWTSVLGGVLADHFGVAFMSPSHTSDLVELTAIGPGSRSIPAYVENHQLHEIVCAALALPKGRLLEGMDAPMVPKRPATDD